MLIDKAIIGMRLLEARGDRPLKMTFDDQLKALIFFHLEEHTSAQYLLQFLEEDDFARNIIAPEGGIKTSTKKACIEAKEINPEYNGFYDAIVLLGTPGVNQTKKPLRLVGYIVDGTKYWVATSRFDLSAEQIALIYKLRWDIEKFFAWWKRHLKVYHLIARSEYGLMVQILAGLITYLLLAIYCREQHNEKVSIKRVRELRINIQNEIRIASSSEDGSNFENHAISF